MDLLKDGRLHREVADALLHLGAGDLFKNEDVFGGAAADHKDKLSAEVRCLNDVDLLVAGKGFTLVHGVPAEWVKGLWGDDIGRGAARLKGVVTVVVGG